MLFITQRKCLDSNYYFLSTCKTGYDAKLELFFCSKAVLLLFGFSLGHELMVSYVVFVLPLSVPFRFCFDTPGRMYFVRVAGPGYLHLYTFCLLYFQ